MAFGVQVTTTFGGTQDPEYDEWHNDFAQATGIVPEHDPNGIERRIDGVYTSIFALYNPEGRPLVVDTHDKAVASIQTLKDILSKAGVSPTPKEWKVVEAGTRRTSQAEEVVIARKLTEEGATPEEIQETLQEVRQTEQVVLKPPTERARRTGPTRPARVRVLDSPREWMEYIRPGDSIPYWQMVGLDRVPDTEVVDPETWRMVYRAWYRTTEKRKKSQKKYNEVLGRAIQKVWEKTDLGRQTRKRYFQSEGGIEARKASQKRSKDRLALAKALREENPEMSDDDIERVFYQQNLRPQFKTPEDFERWLHKKTTDRINPATGDELI